MPVSPPPDFARTLIEWHAAHGRHALPWQNTRDPYRIWLSEIMLQQTQVDTVIPYYRRFLERFPDIASLAAAPQDKVLGLWSGLGYYARARNLHRAAQKVMSDWNGQFPPSAAGLATLPGIGRSTAAAIASFAYGERAAILDGNVKRVLCRIYGIDGFPGEKTVENHLWALAERLLPERDVHIYIQAQMDLGATLCTRSRPACERCPFAAHCVAFQEQRVSSLPAPRPRRTRPTRSTRMAVVLGPQHAVLLQQRPASGIWGGLLSLPELADDCDPVTNLTEIVGDAVRPCGTGEPFQHAFTHFTLHITPEVFAKESADASQLPDGYVWLAPPNWDAAPLPTPVRQILTALAADNLLRRPRLPGM